MFNIIFETIGLGAELMQATSNIYKAQAYWQSYMV